MNHIIGGVGLLSFAYNFLFSFCGTYLSSYFFFSETPIFQSAFVTLTSGIDGFFLKEIRQKCYNNNNNNTRNAYRRPTND